MAVGVQECAQSLAALEALVQRQLGPHFAVLERKGLWEIKLVVWVNCAAPWASLLLSPPSSSASSSAASPSSSVHAVTTAAAALKPLHSECNHPNHHTQHHQQQQQLFDVSALVSQIEAERVATGVMG